MRDLTSTAGLGTPMCSARQGRAQRYTRQHAAQRGWGLLASGAGSRDGPALAPQPARDARLALGCRSWATATSSALSEVRMRQPRSGARAGGPEFYMRTREALTTHPAAWRAPSSACTSTGLVSRRMEMVSSSGTARHCTAWHGAALTAAAVKAHGEQHHRHVARVALQHQLRRSSAVYNPLRCRQGGVCMRRRHGRGLLGAADVHSPTAPASRAGSGC